MAHCKTKLAFYSINCKQMKLKLPTISYKK